MERKLPQKKVERRAKRLIRNFKRNIAGREVEEFRRRIEFGDRVYVVNFGTYGNNQQLILQSLLRGTIEESLFVRSKGRKEGEPGLIHYYHWRGGRVGKPHLENSALAAQKAEDFLTRLKTLFQPQAATL